MRIYYNKNLKKRARYLRKNSTLAEVLLWNQLKGRKLLGYQFMRQKPILKYIVDFYCSKLKLIIEVDGESHVYKFKKDLTRQKKLEAIGLSFLRFADIEVKLNMEAVMESITNWIIDNTRIHGVISDNPL